MFNQAKQWIHSFATLIGVGATTVNPYLALDGLYQRFEKTFLENFNTRNVSVDI